MDVRIKVEGETAQFTIVGELRFSTSLFADGFLAETGRRGVRHYVLDLTETVSIDDLALATIVNLVVSQPFAHVTICTATGEVRDHLCAVGLDAHATVL